MRVRILEHDSWGACVLIWLGVAVNNDGAKTEFLRRTWYL